MSASGQCLHWIADISRRWQTAVMDADLSTAVQVYLGYGAAPFPREDSGVVRVRYGSALLKRVEAVAQDAGSLRPDWETHSLLSAKDWAESELKQRHPDLNDAAISALGWAFSYWWK
jgi:hypothetical protein